MRITTVEMNALRRAKNIFLPVFKGEPLEKAAFFAFLPAPTRAIVKKFIAAEFKAEDGETKRMWSSKGQIARIAFFGLGERKLWNARKKFLVSRRMVQYAKREKIEEFTVPLTDAFGDEGERAFLFSSNAVLADYDFNRYKEIPKGGWPKIKEITVAASKEMLPITREGTRDGIIIGEEANRARDLANTPGGDMTPKLLAAEAKRAGKEWNIPVTIFDEKKMKALGMGGILGVAQGSTEPPRFIIMEYRGSNKNQKPLVLVGKGVTFDTGGLNIKPDQYIYEMHMDMSGGAAVIHGIAAIARLKLPINAVGIVPAVENMPSGSSYRPGDLLKTMSGKTIEVLNTDAEGRIILSDALFYGWKHFKPGLMVDFATLTGAAHVAVGNFMSAVFAKKKETESLLVDVGTKSGDYVWPFPLWDEYLADIKGTFGDLSNIGKGDRYGGAIHGAKFLEQFTGEADWAHIDIAPKMTTIDSEFLSKGASGVGVRFIVELAKRYIGKIPNPKSQIPNKS